MASLSWADQGSISPQREVTNNRNRPKQTQARQLLSCTTCRTRKVKCDRTIPCSACCARGHPKECEFIVGEGNEYGPIPQSYEIRKLRQENKRLKEQLQALRHSHSDDDGGAESTTDRNATRNSRKQSIHRQRAFKAEERIDNLYFGTPGLNNVASDFAALQAGVQSLTHTVPRGREFYPAESSAYPFPVISTHSTSASLLELLPPADELFEYLELFHQRGQPSSFPYIPEEMTRAEVERFLSDTGNAQKSPDMLALLFATLATGLQMGQYDHNGGEWNLAAAEPARLRGDAFLAASMQCLRNSSFMNTPSLLGIQALVMMGPYLTNTGRFLDAWTLFGTTVRLAQSIGLHRNPKFLDPVPPLPQCAVRQTLWWWMVHMDQDYSIALGRPLGISGLGDCPPPQQLTTNPTMLRLAEFTDQYTILARQILASDGMMSIAKIDEFTDKLLGLWDTMPNALVFHERWLEAATPLPEWPLEVAATSLFVKVQSLLILLNRHRIERTQNASPKSSSSTHNNSPPHLASSPQHSRHRSYQLPSSPESVEENSPGAARSRGRPLVISSCIKIVNAFMFTNFRNPAGLICWSMGQQAFNACMILILDAWETEDDRNEGLIEQAFAVFRQLEMDGVHSLAGLAVARISEALLNIGLRRDEREKEALLSPRSSHDISPVMSFDTRPPPSVSTTAPGLDAWIPTDTVMSDTGMFLLEDPGLQSFVPPSFHPLSWGMLSPDQQQAPPLPPPLPPPQQPQTSYMFKPLTPPMGAHITSPPRPHPHQLPPQPYPLAPSPFLPSTTPLQMPLAPPPSPYALPPHHHDPSQPRTPIRSAFTLPQQHHQHQLPQPAFTPINLNVSLQGPMARRHHYQHQRLKSIE